MPGLWRDDEGAGFSEEDPAPAPPRTLWKSHEGKPVPGEEAGDARRKVWHGDEGHHTSPSVSERRAPAAPRAPTVRPPARVSRRASFVRTGLLTLLLLGVLLAADGAYVGFKLKSALEESARRLEQGLDLFREGDIATARAELGVALEKAGEARDLASHPSMVLATVLPVIRHDARAAAAIVEAGHEVATAGLAAADGASLLGLDRDGFAESVFENGRVALEPLEAAAVPVTRATDALERARAYLDAAPRANVALIRTSLADGLDRVEEALAVARKGRALVTALPGLLGGESDRRYLLVFQTPSEARGGGGVAGLYGIVTASDGVLRLGRIGPYAELFRPRSRPVDAPGWFAASYGAQGALTEWPQANVSPNFPVVVGVMAEMYEAESGRAVDGVLAMDPVALASLMRGTGPMEVRRGPGGRPVAVTSDNVVELLLHDSYLDFPTEASQDSFLTEVVDLFWDKLQSGDVDARSLGEGIADAVDAQHFKAAVVADAEQDALAELGLLGAYPGTGPQTQLIYNNNYGINKVDYFLERELSSTIELDSNGVAHVTTTVALHNRAPDGPRSLLLGLSGNGTPVGTNRMMLSFLLPEGASVTSLQVGGSERAPLFYSDADHPVAWFVTDVPAGRSEVATLTYDVEGAASFNGRMDDYALSFVPQATVNPDAITVTVIPPDGFSFGRVEGATITPDGRATVTRVLDETLHVSASIERD